MKRAASQGRLPRTDRPKSDNGVQRQPRRGVGSSLEKHDVKPKLLIVEDDEVVRCQWRWALADEFEVFLAEDRTHALEMFQTERPEVALVDLGLPPHADDPSEGLAVVNRIRSLDHQAKVIVVSGLPGKENAVRAVGEGACDYLPKPVPLADLKLLVQRYHQVATLERECLAMRLESGSPELHGLHGGSPQMQELFMALRKVGPADAPVLIVGESGTGKETAARAIHRLSDRREGPFVSVDCAAIPPEQIEVELFGMEAVGAGGAASASRRPGRIELASAGTLFVDGLDELPQSLQIRLLRLLQERRIERTGAHASVVVDTRIIAACSQDPTTLLAAGQLRADLYYLLAVVVIRIPPLRERREDVRLLAEGFLHRFAQMYHKPALQLGAAALQALVRHTWPGNVRELENCLKRAVIMADGNILDAADLDLPSPSPSRAATGLREARQGTEREMLVRALRRHQGRIAPAAAELGISRPTFYALMHRLGIRRRNEGAIEPPPSTDGQGI